MGTNPSAEKSIQLARHFDHRSAEPHTREEPLRCLVPLRGQQHDAWHAARPQERQHGHKEQAAHASTAMLRVDDDVLQNSRRTPQRHVVVPFDSGVRVADHIPVVIGDEDSFVRIFELCAYERRIARRRP